MFDKEDTVSLGTEATDLKTRTMAFARRVIRFFSALPRNPVAQVPGRQLLRSGTSFGANYREAFRARSKAEFIAKLGDRLEEAEESEYWLELIHEGQIVPSSRLKPLLQESCELMAIFAASIRSAKNWPDAR
ncbi:MAG TPA: four helix bundle protein [Verrucomicrobiota bacterium]|nr:four helix bundle protein [Verrucomicrobiota bacterium]